MSDPMPLPLAVGRAVRGLRDRAGVSADEVARAARRCGLSSWQQSVVAGLETGRRGLSAEELLLLPYVMTYALEREVGLAELLPAPVRLGNSWAGERDIADLLSDHPIRRVLLEGQAVALGRAVADATREFQQSYPPGTRVGDIVDAENDLAATSEAERIAARKLGVTAMQVAVAARQRWGQSLTDERDRLLQGRVPDDAPTSSVRAMRGRITRGLVAQLAEDLKHPEGRQ